MFILNRKGKRDFLFGRSGLKRVYCKVDNPEEPNAGGGGANEPDKNNEDNGQVKTATEIALEKKLADAEKALAAERAEKKRMAEGAEKEVETAGAAIADINNNIAHFELNLKFHENDSISTKQRKLAETLIKDYKLDYKLSPSSESIANDCDNVVRMSKKILLDQKEAENKATGGAKLQSGTPAMRYYKNLQQTGRV